MNEQPGRHDEEKQFFNELNQTSVEFLLNRYNKVNRWVIADMIRRSAYHFPDKTALVFNDQRWSYQELEAETNKVANALMDLGVEKYERVAILAHNTAHHILTWLGCCKVGAVYLAINYLLRGPDIQYCINHSESKVFIVEDALYELVQGVMGEMPTVRTFIWSNQGAGQDRPNTSFLDFDTWYPGFPDRETDRILRIEDPCQMTYTSGTESKPKGVIITNQALIAQYMGCIVDGRYENSDINVNAMPIYHCAQRDVFLNPIFYLGGTNILLGPDIGQILKTIQDTRANMLFVPPTVWIGILRHPEFKKFDLTSLNKIYYGASIMPVEVLKELMEQFPGAGIYNYYGQTELAPYHTILKAEHAWDKLGAAGMGGLNMETSIEADDGQVITETDTPGEICGRGPHTMLMYFKEPEKTEAVMRGGWFHSGDLGVLDVDRFVSVVDRKKDMVKTGGENVPSREVEEAIYLDARIEEVAVVGVPHPKWVEAVTAVVVPRQGETITEAEVLENCRKHLAGFKVPKKIVFVDALPKTPTGKILKREMRDTYNDLFA